MRLEDKSEGTSGSEADGLLADFARAIGVYRGEGRFITFVHFLLFLIVLNCAAGNSYIDMPGGDFPIVFCALSGLAMAYIFGFLLRRTAALRLRRVTKRLSQVDDVRTVGSLIDALRLRDKPTRVIAEKGFVHVLKSIRADDAGLLNQGQREFLYSILQSSSKELTLVTLRALSQIGNREDMWYVERLTDGGYRLVGFPLSTDTEVQVAAKRCLEAIRERLENRRCSQTLLRPAATDSPSDSLLHPASASGESDSQQLLRPGSTENA